MSKTLLNVNTTDTFQVWLQRTNDLVNELKTSIVTASLSGDTTVGSATLTANFSANTVIGRNFLRTNALDSIAVGDTISVFSRTDFTPPISTGVSITQSSGPKVVYDNNSIRWLAGIRGSTGTGTGSEFVVGLEGTTNYSLRITSAGTVYANTIVLDSDSSSATAAVRADRSITTENGITGGGNFTADRTFSLTGQALALHSLNTNGIVVRTGSDTVAARTITAGTGITITNGNGVSGNPTVAIDATVVVNRTANQSISGNKSFANAVVFDSNIYVGGSTTLSGSATTINSSTLTISGNTVFTGQPTVSGTSPSILLNDTNGQSFYVHVNNDLWYVLNSSGSGIIYTDASGNFTAAGNITAFSDERLKKNIRLIDDAVSKVSKMRGVYFDKDGKPGVGVIAQEVEKILPEVVQDGEFKSVAYGNIVGLLIEAIKELKSEIEDLKVGK